MRTSFLAPGLLIALSCSGCSSAPPQTPVSQGEPAPVQETKDDAELLVTHFFAKGDSLSYNGYEVLRLNKEVNYQGSKVPVSYAILRRNGRVLATFDGVFYILGNATDFRLAALLGGKSKQLVISLTIPRAGRHWVVDVSSDGAVLFDSFDYGLGRENGFVKDIDKDGVSEIGLALTAFWGFGSMTMSESPLPTIVFKYDPHRRKYLPANPAFFTTSTSTKTFESSTQTRSPVTA